MKNFKEVELTEGRFAGKTLVIETPGTTMEVVCSECGWKSCQTFFINDFTKKDICGECSKCGNPDLELGDIYLHTEV